ncbi:hypothetical protein RND81_05G043000 [Saponaria officinalis]|uniref:SCP domain-containing protein n=1 Tax=Saponaria officinalis TaxID=3572 RepID=A0AAW1KUF5_SAPOF
MLFTTPNVIILQVLLISSYFVVISNSIIIPQNNVLNNVEENLRRIRHTLHHIRRPMAREFLRAHNLIRAKYDIPPLQWDRTLARIARRRASILAKDCSMVHSRGQYGENLFWGKLDHWTPARMVEDWANEVQFFDLNTKKCTKDWTECGHFTQVIWADSQRVGCHRQKCILQVGFIGICIYDPPGNAVDQSPFDIKND